MTGHLESFRLMCKVLLSMHGRERMCRGKLIERKCMKLTSSRVLGYQLFREIAAITFVFPPVLIIVSCEGEGFFPPPSRIKCCVRERSSMWSEPAIASAVLLSKTQDKTQPPLRHVAAGPWEEPSVTGKLEDVRAEACCRDGYSC